MTIHVAHPDYRACLWHWSGDQDDLTAMLPKGQIATEALPTTKVFPIGKITELPGDDIATGTGAVYRKLFQFDVWGGSPSATYDIAELWLRLLLHELPGVHETPAGTFSAGLVTSGGIRRTTEPIKSQAPEGAADVETSRARPRCHFDAQIVLRPARAGAGS